MPHKYFAGSELKESKEVGDMALISDDKAPIMAEPGEESFNFPSTFVATKRSAILGSGAVATVWCDHLDAQGIKVAVERVAVVGFVADQSLGQSDAERLKGLSDQAHFCWRSACCANGERKTISICDGHDFGAFSPLGLSDVEPPFFAGLKVPSINASLRLSFPRRCNS